MVKKETKQLDGQWTKFRREINQDFKAHINTVEDRMRVHLGVLVEDFDSKIKPVAEQHASIMRVLENHTQRLKAIEKKLIDMDIRLDRIEDNLKRKVDYEEFRGLIKRVTLLESRLSRKA